MSFWGGRSVFIMGANGFVGAHLAQALMALGAVVVGADRGETVDHDRVPPSASLRALGVKIPVLQRNAEDSENYAMTLRDLRPSVVFHLAGASDIAWCQANPTEAVRANILSASNALDACRRLGNVSALVLASSSRVYGRMSSSPRWRESFETDPLNPQHVYGATKGAADLLAESYRVSYRLPVGALRHVSLFGPACPHRAHVIMAAIRSLLDGQPPVLASDGTPMKAYLHVADGVAAYLRVAELVASGHGGIYNASTAPIPELALIDALIQAAGLDLVPDVRGEDRSQTGFVEMINSQKLRANGWAPAASLMDGLRQTWRWYAQHREWFSDV